jgi:ClpP class serine protease
MNLSFNEQERVKTVSLFRVSREDIEADWTSTKEALEKAWPRPGRKLLFIIHGSGERLSDDDATDVMADVALLPKSTPIDLIIHSEGGSAAASDRVSGALVGRRRTATFVPFMAMSGGTQIALSTQKFFLARVRPFRPTTSRLATFPQGRSSRLPKEMTHLLNSKSRLLS